MDKIEGRRVALFFKTLREQTVILERAVGGDQQSQARLFGTYGDVIQDWCAELYRKDADVAEVEKLAKAAWKQILFCKECLEEAKENVASLKPVTLGGLLKSRVLVYWNEILTTASAPEC